MLKKILVVSLAAGTLALNAPVALAQHTMWDCGFDAIAQETATGGEDTFTGVIYGWAATQIPGEFVDVRCWIEVNGSPVTDWRGDGVNRQVDTYWSPGTYTAGDTDNVALCGAVYTGTSPIVSPDGPKSCDETTTTQIPPQELIDLLDSVFQLVTDLTAPLDPIICGVLQTAGVPFLINTYGPRPLSMDADDCDLYLEGERLVDFVPYQD